jgi:hypothetical protein
MPIRVAASASRGVPRCPQRYTVYVIYFDARLGAQLSASR